MKEIWNNLELYFESYEFSNFRDFLRIFLKLLLIFKWLQQLKKEEKGATWMRRGTQGYMAAPRGTYAARCDMHIYIYRNYKGYSTYKHSVFGI